MSRAKAASERKGNPTKAKDKTVVAGKFGPKSFERPTMPLYLEVYPSASVLWVEVWDDIESISAKSDRFLVERYVHLQSERLKIIEDLDGKLTTMGSQGGNIVLHPKVRRLSDIEGKLVPLEDRLGLSPESRARLGIAENDNRDEFEQWMDEA